MNLKEFRQAGHWPTLLASFLYFDFSFMAWVTLGPLVVYRATNAEAVLERFKEHALVAVFNGHYHAKTERMLGQTTLTTNRCCSFSRKNHDNSKEKGYFLCEARDGKVTRQFVEFALE